MTAGLRDSLAGLKLLGGLLRLDAMFPRGFSAVQLADHAQVTPETARAFLSPSKGPGLTEVVDDGAVLEAGRGRPSKRYRLRSDRRDDVVSRLVEARRALDAAAGIAEPLPARLFSPTQLIGESIEELWEELRQSGNFPEDAADRLEQLHLEFEGIEADLHALRAKNPSLAGELEHRAVELKARMRELEKAIDRWRSESTVAASPPSTEFIELAGAAQEPSLVPLLAQRGFADLTVLPYLAAPAVLMRHEASGPGSGETHESGLRERLVACWRWLGSSRRPVHLAARHFLAGKDSTLSYLLARTGERRQRRGLESLTAGLVALADGDASRATFEARRAAVILGTPELGNLICAQAALTDGRISEAKSYFDALALDQRTRMIGIRGLMAQASQKGDIDTALRLGVEGLKFRPRDYRLLRNLYKLQALAGDWSSARGTLARMFGEGLVRTDERLRGETALLVSEAIAALKDGDISAARDASLRAHYGAPEFAPAAVTACGAFSDDRDHCEKILRTTWRLAPHPEVAAAFAALTAEESAADRRVRFEALIDENRNHPESRLLSAELALAADDEEYARVSLGDLADTFPTARSLSILAAIEWKSGSSERAVKLSLARALRAPRGECWTCGYCAYTAESWTPLCPNCQSFATLEWREPLGAGQSHVYYSQRAAMPSFGYAGAAFAHLTGSRAANEF